MVGKGGIDEQPDLDLAGQPRLPPGPETEAEVHRYTPPERRAMAQKRPGPRPSAAAAAAAAASQKRRHQERGAVHGDGHASGSVTSSSATAAASSVTVTHLYASSIAVPARSSLDALETQLLEKAEYIGPLLQRDVVMQRMDDLDEARMALEQADSSFGPMRRARVQSRLQMRLEDGKAEMRMYSQAQQRAPGAASTTGNTVGGGSGSASGATGAQAGAGAGAGVGVSSGSSQSNNAVASSQTGAASRVPDYVRVKNLTCSALQGDADACSGQRAVQTEARAGEGAEIRPVSASIDPGQGFWKQATAVLGWM